MKYVLTSSRWDLKFLAKSPLKATILRCVKPQRAQVSSLMFFGTFGSVVCTQFSKFRTKTPVSIFLRPEEGCRHFLRNVVTLTPDYTT